MTLRRKGDFFKLAVSNYHRVIIAGGNPAAKLFPVRRFKILFRRHQHIGSGIKPQKIRAPLFGQMVGNHHKAFLCQPQAFGFHRRRHNLKGLARAHTMSQQAVSTVEHPGYRVALVGPQGNFRIHTGKPDMLPVVAAGPDGVIEFIVLLTQVGTSGWIFPNPILECFPDLFLLLLGQHGFFGIEHTAGSAIRIVDGIIYPCVPKVQAVLNDGVGVSPFGSVGHIGQGIV